jgi:alpha,alpha-trehalose phosphorylase
MPNTIRALLFDLDGVVVYTDRYHYLAWKRLADEQGYAFDETVNNALRGVPRLESLRLILVHNGVELPLPAMEELCAIKNRYYVELLRGITEEAAVPGALDFIRRARALGLETALCSSSKNAGMVLDALGIRELFDTVVTGSDIRRAKPEPEIFELAARKLGVHPFNCLVFEDARSGVQAALAAGMKCLFLGQGAEAPEAPDAFTRYDELDLEALAATAKKQWPIALPWSVVEKEVALRRAGYAESVFSLCNGYLGLRGTYEEDVPELERRATPGTFINGVYELEPVDSVLSDRDSPRTCQKLVNLADFRVIRLFVDGEPFDPLRGECREYRRELDFRAGTSVRSLVWQSPRGKRVRIAVTRLVSMRRRHSAAIRYEVTPLGGGAEIRFESVVRAKTRTPNIAAETLDVLEKGTAASDVHFFRTRTKVSEIGIACACAHSLNVTGQSVARFGETDLSVTVDLAARENETIVLDKHVAFFSTLECPEQALVADAVATAGRDRADGFETLEKEQAEFWHGYFSHADIEVDGPVADQQALRFSSFHLRQNHPEDSLRSISATGVSGHNYMGWVFWDTEIFMCPAFGSSEPELVRDLLRYRYRHLDAARQRARELGGPGACYPWSTVNGAETNAGYFVSTAQYHINSDIAYAVARYHHDTGDDEFLDAEGAEIVFETARFMAWLGKHVPLRDDKFCINFVCGPDEYNYCVDNNCYTNMMAALHFENACRYHAEMRARCPERLAALSERIGLTEAEIASFRRAAELMYIPYHEGLGIHAQDDGYLYRDPVDVSRLPQNYEIKKDLSVLNLGRMRVTKQADLVLAMVLLPERFTPEEKRRNYEFYAPLTLHASSLSPAVHAVASAELGLMDESYAFFRQASQMDLSDLKDNTAAGIHLAAAGGTWMAVVQGFAGLRHVAEGIRFEPRLPKAWRGYRFELTHRKNRIRVEVDADGARYELVEGPGLEFSGAGTMVRLCPDSPRARSSLA